MSSQDRAYLINQQYRDGGNLDARIQLHERYSKNPQGLHPWMHTQFNLKSTSRLLELGGGTGLLWRSLPDSQRAELRLTLTLNRCRCMETP